MDTTPQQPESNELRNKLRDICSTVLQQLDATVPTSTQATPSQSKPPSIKSNASEKAPNLLRPQARVQTISSIALMLGLLGMLFGGTSMVMQYFAHRRLDSIELKFNQLEATKNDALREFSSQSQRNANQVQTLQRETGAAFQQVAKVVGDLDARLKEIEGIKK